MKWRLDWILFATGLIALGMTMIRKGRSELFALLGDDANTDGILAVLLGGYLVPACLLGVFVIRLLIRMVTGQWK
jgi:hypothetical protein